MNELMRKHLLESPFSTSISEGLFREDLLDQDDVRQFLHLDVLQVLVVHVAVFQIEPVKKPGEIKIRF